MKRLIESELGKASYAILMRNVRWVQFRDSFAHSMSTVVTEVVTLLFTLGGTNRF